MDRDSKSKGGRPGALAAIFDMDGLLVDSEPLWQEAEIEVFAGVGVHLTRSDCAQTKGRRVDDTVAHWFGLRPWQGPGPAEIERRLVLRVAELIREKAEPKDGVGHALEFFANRGLKRALASSSPRTIIDAVLERLGLDGAFEVVHSGADEPLGKPDPAVYLTTAARLGVAPGACVALEDSVPGMIAAKRAGMRCIVVPDASSSLPGDEDRFRNLVPGPDLVLSSLWDLDEATWKSLADGEN